MNTRNLTFRAILYGPDYRPPVLGYKLGNYRNPSASQRPFGTRQKCRSDEPGGGLTNGMPWDGTSPISEATEIDAPRLIPVSPERAGTPVEYWDLEKLWAMAGNPFFSVSWLDIAKRFGNMSTVMLDKELAAEIELLGDIALQRHLDLNC